MCCLCLYCMQGRWERLDVLPACCNRMLLALRHAVTPCALVQVCACGCASLPGQPVAAAGAQRQGEAQQLQCTAPRPCVSHYLPANACSQVYGPWLLSWRSH